MSKGKGWPILGSVREGFDESGKSTGRYIKIPDNVTILVDGEKVDFNKSRTAQLVSPTAQVERLYKAGAIEEKNIEFRREKANEASKWLKYEIVIPPPRD